MHVCTYVCMYVCMYAGMYVCMHVSMFVLILTVCRDAGNKITMCLFRAALAGFEDICNALIASGASVQAIDVEGFVSTRAC